MSLPPRPFDIGVFVAPIEKLVRLDVTTAQGIFSGGYTPEQARTVAGWLMGAADVAEGKATTAAGRAFLEQAQPEKPEPAS